MLTRFTNTLSLIGLLIIGMALSACTSSEPVNSQLAKKAYSTSINSVAGNPKGTVTLVEFFDYRCPYCRNMFPVIQKLIMKDPYLRIVYKEYLLFGDKSIEAASSALAARLQNRYLAMHNALMTATEPLTKKEIMKLAKHVGMRSYELEVDMKDPAILEQLKANTKLAHEMKVTTAPTLFIGPTQLASDPTEQELYQYRYVGKPNFEDIQRLIDKVHRKTANQ